MRDDMLNGPEHGPPHHAPRQSAERTAAIQSDVVVWAIIDGILLVVILGGNTLTILAVRFSRRLRGVISNLFVLSLAISDMVVGFTLPYHLAFYMGSGLGEQKCWCLLRFFLIILACCVSIWNLIAIAVDRYIAIVYPLHYSRYMTKKVALILLAIGWGVGFSIAAVPMFWNNWPTALECEFDEVLPPWYMAGVITPVFSMVWVCLLIVYWRIWREASKHAKQLRSSFSGSKEGPSDWKSVQVVLLILGCFSICWMPYFIIACAQIFKFLEHSSPTLYKGAFSLAMANSGMNPVIYAWKNSNFRRAFSRLLKCKGPDTCEQTQECLRSNLHRKSSSINQHDTLNGDLPNYSTPPPLQKSTQFGNDLINSSANNITDTTMKRTSQILTHNYSSECLVKNTPNEIQSNLRQSIICEDNTNNNNNRNNNIRNSERLVRRTSTRKSLNEITMNNIIINKCAIIENLENNEKEKLADKKLNSLTTDVDHKIATPVECVINNENGTIIYHINLVNDLK